LVGFFGSTDIFSKCDLILLLGDIGPPAGAAIPKLRELLHTEGHLGLFFRTRSASALARIDPKNPEYVDYLISCLTADEALLRWLAADGLGRVGPGAARATAPLIKAREEENPAVRMFAASALWKITHRPELCLRTLVCALEEPGSPANLRPLGTLNEALPHHLIAASFFGQLGAGAFEALPELITRFSHPQPDHYDVLVRRNLLLGINRIAAFDPRVCEVSLEAAFGLHPPLQLYAWYILLTSPPRTLE
jgi:HEAT repeat protein